MFSRSVTELKAAGFLSSRGKILHVGVELSIPASSFVRRLQIFASITHKFDLEELLNADLGERVDGSVVKVVHNNVKLDFKLLCIPNDTGHRTGFYVKHIKGPNNDLVMDFEIIVIKGRKRHSILRRGAYSFTLDAGGSGCAVLPRTIEELRAAGYLSWDNKLHVIAELSIPESAFAVPEAKSTLVQVDTVGFQLYQEITTPANTASPASSRVELVSNDGTHLWAHKDVLSCASDVFKDLFDPNRPEEAKMDCFKKGVLTFDGLSGEALKQMLHFVYMRQTGKEFEKFALGVLPVADRFSIKGLKEVCERRLIDEMDIMPLESLCQCLADSYTLNLPALTAACTETLPMIIEHTDVIDLKHFVSLIDLSRKHSLAPLKTACEEKLAHVLDNTHDRIDPKHLMSLIDFSREHSLAPLTSACEEKLAHILDNTHDRALFLSLLSLARENQLEVLVTHCVRWFRNKYDVLKAGGFITELMNGSIENGQNVLAFLLDSVVTLPSH